MKKLVGIIILAVLGVMISIFIEARKPELFAGVGIGREKLIIENMNKLPWVNAAIYVNMDHGPNYYENHFLCEWAPGEKKELNLRDFKCVINNQEFNSEVQRAHDITIMADGFQVGIYKK